MTKMWWILIWVLKSRKNLLFDWFFLVVFNLKTLSFMTLESDAKFVVWKRTWGICQIYTRTLESLKIGTSIGFFCPKSKIYELKIYRGVGEGGGSMCHDNDGSGIWRILIRALKHLKNVHLTGLSLTKIYNVWAKKVQDLYLMPLNIDAKFVGKWLLFSKKIWRIWEIFTRALESLNIWTLMRFFYPK